MQVQSQMDIRSFKQWTSHLIIHNEQPNYEFLMQATNHKWISEASNNEHRISSSTTNNQTTSSWCKLPITNGYQKLQTMNIDSHHPQWTTKLRVLDASYQSQMDAVVGHVTGPARLLACLPGLFASPPPDFRFAMGSNLQASQSPNGKMLKPWQPSSHHVFALRPSSLVESKLDLQMNRTVHISWMAPSLQGASQTGMQNTSQWFSSSRWNHTICPWVFQGPLLGIWPTPFARNPEREKY